MDTRHEVTGTAEAAEKQRQTEAVRARSGEPQSDQRAEGNSSLRSSCQNAYQYVKRAVEENPKSSLLVPLALGIGTGLMIGLSLGNATARRRRKEKEWFGHHMWDYLSERLPESVAQRMKR